MLSAFPCMRNLKHALNLIIHYPEHLLSQNETFLNKVTEALLEKKSLLYSDIRGIRSSTVKSHVAVTHEASSQCYQLQEEEKKSISNKLVGEYWKSLFG